MKITTAVDEPVYHFTYDKNTELYNYILDNKDKFFAPSRLMTDMEGYVKSYVFENYTELPEDFREWIYSCFKEVVNAEGIVTPKFFISASWLNRMDVTGQQHNCHFHPNSIMSGVYAIRCMKPNNRLIMLNGDNRGDSQLFINLTEKEKKKRAFIDDHYGSREKMHENNTGTLIIHRSTLTHGVPPFEKMNEADFRLTISFNIWMHELGEFRHATSLSVSRANEWVSG
jgi:hypothetical protein